MKQEEREKLADIVFSRGWKIVESLFDGRADRIRKALETCEVEELKALQARLEEITEIRTEIHKEARKSRKENDEE